MKAAKFLAAIFLFRMLGQHAEASSVSYAQDTLPNHNAFFVRSSGNAGTLLDWQSFKPNVETAIAEGRGGIIDFESPGSVVGGTTIQTGFNSDQSFFQVTARSGSLERRSDASLADNGPFPSGLNVLSTAVLAQRNNNFFFDGFAISGQSSGLSLLTEIGFILLGDRYSNITKAEVTAIFSGGGTLTLNSNLPPYVESDSVFYGFRAPPGQSIVSLSSDFGTPQPERIVLMDDLGFVVTQIPEPKTSAVMIVVVAVFQVLRVGWIKRRIQV